MIEGGFAARIRLRCRQQCPDASAAAIRGSFHDPGEGAVLIVRHRVANDVDRALRPDRHALSAVRDTMIGNAIHFGAGGGPVSRHQINPENITIEFQVVKLLVARIFGKADRIRAAVVGGVEDEADLDVCIHEKRRSHNTPCESQNQLHCQEETKTGFRNGWHALQLSMSAGPRQCYCYWPPESLVFSNPLVESLQRMNIAALHVGMKVKHTQYGVGTVK